MHSTRSKRFLRSTLSFHSKRHPESSYVWIHKIQHMVTTYPELERVWMFVLTGGIRFCMRPLVVYTSLASGFWVCMVLISGGRLLPSLTLCNLWDTLQFWISCYHMPNFMNSNIARFWMSFTVEWKHIPEKTLLSAKRVKSIADLFPLSINWHQ